MTSKTWSKVKKWAMEPSGFGSVRRREAVEHYDEMLLGVPKFWDNDMLGLDDEPKRKKRY